MIQSSIFPGKYLQGADAIAELPANLALKEQALAKTTPANIKNTGRYRPDDKLLAFLKGL